MLLETLLRLVTIGLCVMVAHNFVRRRAKDVARVAASVKLPPRLLEIVVTTLLAVPAIYAILYLLSVVGIITE